MRFNAGGERKVKKQEPRDHHYVPQFYLRNFASDAERRKIATVAKNGHLAVWSVRSIRGLGYEQDLYVHERNGVPVSVEARINRRLETPLSSSETWRKISSGRTEALDRTDRPVLYALIRHLQSRTPHARDTVRRLSHMAASPDSEIPFTDEERHMYAAIRRSPDAYMNAMASTLEWTVREFDSCGISIFRSPIPLRTSTTPVLAVTAPEHPALALNLPGMTPFTFVLPLNSHTLAVLALGDFDGHLVNREISALEAQGYNQQYLGQFAFFPMIRHLITGRDALVAAMTWAPYDLVDEDDRKIVFRRRPTAS